MSASLPPAPAPAAATSAVRTSPREIALLLTLAAMQFTHVVDFMIMMPLGPQFMRLFEIDPSESLQAILTHTGGGSMTVEVAGKRRYRTS